MNVIYNLIFVFLGKDLRPTVCIITIVHRLYTQKKKDYRIFPKYGPGVNYFQMVIRPGVKLKQAFF